MRIHVIAIGSITALVFLLYLLVVPKEAPEKAEFSGNNYVQISSATWGLNCNDHVRHAIKEAQAEIAAAPREKRDEIQIPKLVTRNNALTHLSKLCNGKEVCNFLAESDIIGLDPIYSCFKNLEVSFRCFDVDRLRNMTFRQGDVAKLDCSQATLNPKK